MKRQVLLLLSGILIGTAAGIAFFFGLNRVKLPDLLKTPNTLSNPDVADGSSTFAPEKGALAPEFALEDLSGNQIALGDFRGKVVLLNFWATWCSPCRIEMPLLQARHEQLSDKLAIVAVDFDEPKDQVQAFVDEMGLTFKVLLDPGGDVQNLYRIRGYPTSIFLGEDSVVQIVHIGIMAESQLDSYLKQLGVIN